jgi:hypothetical protein
MNHKIQAAVIFMLLFAAATIGCAHAGSMLNSASADCSDGLIIIGEETEDQLGKDVVNEEVMYVSLKKKMDKIWGADEVRRKMQGGYNDEDMADLNTDLPAIMVSYRVQTSTPYRYRHNYSSRHRGRTPAGTDSSVQYLNITPIIVREARRNDISPRLLKGVIQAESNYNPSAVSRVGAMGLCQLMPGTARMLGVRDPFNPEESIVGGAKYLGMLKKMFRSTDLVLAGYNAGPGAVSRTGGVPNIYETRNYIQVVRRNMKQ